MARRKITKTNDLGDLASRSSDLPDLTDQQLAFVRGICSGLKASDAYRRAYDCSNMAASTIWANSSTLRADKKVAAWIAAAREAHLDQTVCTKENHLDELARLKEIAVKTGNVGAAVQAEQLRGKVQGHYIERLELDISSEPTAALDQISKLAPDLARKLAEEHGFSTTEH
jgi:hypothetical protein